eukprot:767693-Hanusia_phi.AAC.7
MAYTDEECMRLFRFRREGIRQLLMRFDLAGSDSNSVKTLAIPCSAFPASTGWTISGESALLLFLYCMAHSPNMRKSRKFFGNMSVSKCSDVFYSMLEYLYKGWGFRATSLENWIDCAQYKADHFSEVNDRDYHNLVGFVDGYVEIKSPAGGINNRRSGLDQQQANSGRTRQNSVRFMGIALSNGLLYVDGPYEPGFEDADVFRESRLTQQLRQAQGYLGAEYMIYGDCVSQMPLELQQSLRKNKCPKATELMNTVISQQGVSVKNYFSEVKKNWKLVDDQTQLDLNLEERGKALVVATMLQNCRALLYGKLNDNFIPGNDEEISLGTAQVYRMDLEDDYLPAM